MKNFMSGMYAASEWIMRFAVVNLLWFIMNLPFVFFLFHLLKGETELLLIIPIIILAPFLFFPATAAMFSSTRDWVLEREESSLVRSYYKYYKENFKKSFLGGVILTGVWAILIADYFYLKDVNAVLAVMFIVFGLFLYVYTVNFFSVNAHYEMRLKDLLKRALLLTTGSPVLCSAVLVSGIILAYVSLRGPLFLLLFFTGSLTAFLSFSAFYRLYLRLIESEKN